MCYDLYSINRTQSVLYKSLSNIPPLDGNVQGYNEVSAAMDPTTEMSQVWV